MDDSLFQILMVTIPAALVVLVSWLLINAFLGSKRERDLLDIKMANQKQTLPMRLQAYERLSVYLERINPQVLVLRINQNNMKPEQLRDALILAIKTEFEHNVSQQIYVTKNTWSIVVAIKDELIDTINKAAGTVAGGGDTLDMIKEIMEYYMGHDRRPMEQALEKIKADVQKMF